MSVVDSQHFAGLIANNTVIVFATFHNVMLLCYHLYRMCGSARESSSRNNQSTLLVVLSIINVSLWVIFTMWTSLMLLGWLPLNCRWQASIAAAIYTYTKLSLYVFFLERLSLSFEHSIFQFRSNHLFVLRGLFVLLAVFNAVTCCLYGDGYYSEFFGTCKARHPLWWIAVTGLTDIVITSAMVVSFARRLLMIAFTCVQDAMKEAQRESEPSSPDIDVTTAGTDAADEKRNKHSLAIPVEGIQEAGRLTRAKRHKMNQDIWKIIKKSTLLNIVASATTQLSLLMLSLFGLVGLFTNLDSVVNCWCVILTFSVHHKVFSKLCCESCVNNTCLSFISCNVCCPITVPDFHEHALELEAVQSASAVPLEAGTSADPAANQKKSEP